MTPRLVLALLRRGGIALLAAVAIGWWAYHLDTVTRAERVEAEHGFRDERAQDRREWTDAFKEMAKACHLGVAPR